MPATREQKIQINRRYRARLRGDDVPLRSKPYTDAEILSIRDAYVANAKHKGPWLERLARTLRRPKANISRFARALGLTDRGRTRGRKPRQKTLRLNTGGGIHGVHIWANRPHPRGMLGKTHTPEVRAEMSKRMKAREHYPMSQKGRDALSRQMVERLKGSPGSINPGKRGIGGRRSDLADRYFRSRYEANYARYLNWRKIAWDYETKTFRFEKITRGARSYTPDFWVPSENAFHEVKGWMDPKSKTKLDRMRRYHPTVKIIIIGADWFKAAERQGLCGLIPSWECRHTRARS